MEITYKITEAEFAKAFKLVVRRGSRSAVKAILFWGFILVCLTLLWCVVNRRASTTTGRNVGNNAPLMHTSQGGASRAPAEKPTTAPSGFWANGGVTFVVFSIFLTGGQCILPILLRRLYKKDPTLQGQFSMQFSPASLSVQNTAGFSAEIGWNIFEYWREAKGMILLVFRAGTFYIVSLANLSEAQRDELRSILTAALPKK